MVIPMGPGKFYGSSLPRTRYYTDVRFNKNQVDPPVPVLDPLLSWANEAHWSMGGLNFKRLHLQGRIEGNLKRLSDEREKLESPSVSKLKTVKSEKGLRSSPPAPMATKRRKTMMVVESSDEEDDALSSESESESESEEEEREKGRVARKLVGEFDKVATPTSDSNSKSKGKGVGNDVMKVVEDLNLNESLKEIKKNKVSKSKTKSGADLVNKRSSPRSSNNTLN